MPTILWNRRTVCLWGLGALAAVVLVVWRWGAYCSHRDEEPIPARPDNWVSDEEIYDRKRAVVVLMKVPPHLRGDLPHNLWYFPYGLGFKDNAYYFPSPSFKLDNPCPDVQIRQKFLDLIFEQDVGIGRQKIPSSVLEDGAYGVGGKGADSPHQYKKLLKFLLIDPHFPLWRTEQQWLAWKSSPEIGALREAILALYDIAKQVDRGYEWKIEGTLQDTGVLSKGDIPLPSWRSSLWHVCDRIVYLGSEAELSLRVQLRLIQTMHSFRKDLSDLRTYTYTFRGEEQTLSGREWRDFLLGQAEIAVYRITAGLGDLVFDSFYEGSFDEEWGQERISYLPGLKTKVRDGILSEGSHLVQEYEALCGEQLADHLTAPMLALLQEEEPPSLRRISLGALLTRLEVGNALRDKEVVMQCEQKLLRRAKKSMGARAMKLRVFDHVLSKAALQTLEFIAIASQTESL